MNLEIQPLTPPSSSNPLSSGWGFISLEYTPMNALQESSFVLLDSASPTFQESISRAVSVASRSFQSALSFLNSSPRNVETQPIQAQHMVHSLLSMQTPESETPSPSKEEVIDPFKKLEEFLSEERVDELKKSAQRLAIASRSYDPLHYLFLRSQIRDDFLASARDLLEPIKKEQRFEAENLIEEALQRLDC